MLVRKVQRRIFPLIALMILLCCLFGLSQNAFALWSYQQIEGAIIQESMKTKFVRPSLALAVAETESSFRSHVVSDAGAIGVMQIMPATAFGLYKVERTKLFDPQTNIRIGVQFLDLLIKRYDGRIDLALSHYNGGSRVMRNGKAKVLPYTRDYIIRVLKQAKYYKQTLANDQHRPFKPSFAVQKSAKYAKVKSDTIMSLHTNHINKWLAVVDMLASTSRR